MNIFISILREKNREMFYFQKIFFFFAFPNLNIFFIVLKKITQLFNLEIDGVELCENVIEYIEQKYLGINLPRKKIRDRVAKQHKGC